MTVGFTNLNESNYQWFSPIIREDMLREYLRNPSMHAIGAVADKTACGVLIYSHDGLSFQILYIAVSDLFRRRKIATGLVATLCRLAKDTASPVFLEFFANCPVEEDDVYLFFDSLSFFSLARGTGCVYRAEREALESSEIMKHAGKAGKEIHRYADLTAGKKRLLLEGAGIDERVAGGDSKEAIEELCLFTGTPEKPETAVFCTAVAEDIVRLNYAWCMKGKEAALIPLLAHVGALLLKRKPNVRALEIAAVTEESDHLTNRLISGVEACALYYEGAFDVDEEPQIPEYDI